MESENKEKFETIRKNVLEEIEALRQIDDEEIYLIIDKKITEESHKSYISLEERHRLKEAVFNNIRKLDILQELVDDPTVSEIMVNGTESIFIERKGKIKEWEKHFDSKEKLEDVIQQIAAKSNRMVNEANPISDSRLENGSRVNIVLNPIAINGPIITIRRFPENPINMEKLIEINSITKEAALFLKNLVRSGYNIFISGGTGSGKTTFLNALSAMIPQDERVITIEDSAELQLIGIKNLVRLESRNDNFEGKNGISVRDLIRSALRMRPDRIIVGEIRGSEAIDMLQAMNTGHDGSLSTGHANSTKDMLSRIETMVLMGMDFPLAAIRRQIASGIDIIVHLGRIRDKSRKVLEISEITGIENDEIVLNQLFEYSNKDEKLVKRNDLKNREKFYQRGIGDDLI
ncbi:pilus assembly protein CpaF [Acetitomaculum ruminis DSM 5522]|uniref:Pilus assembly protein CpaF n=1 Tax=Acetitomaculum ruminis DSM 5522 TaxID=1120918 RepID=A0A1I0Y9S9_9FIRM|nr:CpaF family protein [Acetitomaculum ruminis]SFB09506.1 pilus assembly protein CpaF [Acetitomaculum ruminis DSM 5522]